MPALVSDGLCDSVGAWMGKVVLGERGVLDFYNKVTNIQNGIGTAVKYTVTNVMHAMLIYTPAANIDPDGDSTESHNLTFPG